MEHVEQLAISTFSTPPILWCRYVHNIFCILDKSQKESFHQHLNSVCKHIQFTKEVEFESSLPFLDVLVSRSGNNISTQIHKKPTHIDRYLPYTLHHPKHQKLAITHSLHNRISSHITDQTERQIARREVRQTLRTNGYPCKYSNPPKPRSQRELPTFTKFTSLSYIQGTTEKIRRILNEVGVKVAMKLIRTIGQYLPSPKDPITTDEITCVVFEVPCKDCDFVYVGQIKRDLNSQFKEHQRAIKQQKIRQFRLV